MRRGFPTVNAHTLEERVERLAQGLARACPRVLGLLADNGPDWLAADLAAERARGRSCRYRRSLRWRSYAAARRWHGRTAQIAKRPRARLCAPA
jgi:long-subunit acyl-CoA synthetase (AMP-forming)